MNFLATTTVTILNGSTTDAYGDDLDNTTPLGSGENQTGIPASIVQDRNSFSLTSEQRPQAIRYFRGRLPAVIGQQSVVVPNGARLRDDNTNDIYIIDAQTQNANPAFTPDVQLSLRRIT